MAGGLISKCADVQADRDKLYKEDYIMRLREFANPNDYFPHDIEAAEPSKENGQNGTVDKVEQCLRKNSDPSKVGRRNQSAVRSAALIAE